MKSKTIAILLTIVALAIGITIYVKTVNKLTPKDYIRIYGPSLVALQHEWVKDGKPYPPPLDKYTQGMTNEKCITVGNRPYIVYGKPFLTLFQMNDPKFA